MEEPRQESQQQGPSKDNVTASARRAGMPPSQWEWLFEVLPEFIAHSESCNVSTVDCAKTFILTASPEHEEHLGQLEKIASAMKDFTRCFIEPMNRKLGRGQLPLVDDVSTDINQRVLEMCPGIVGESQLASVANLPNGFVDTKTFSYVHSKPT